MNKSQKKAIGRLDLRRLGSILSNRQGNTIAYIAVVLIIFGVLGVVMASLMTSSITGTATPNYSRRALYVSEAGMRYGLSELRNSGFATATIDHLNSTTYTLGAGETFELNVFGPWFDSTSNQSFSSGGYLILHVPRGKLPQDFNIPAGLWVVNFDHIGENPSYTTSRDLIEDFTKIDDPDDATLSIHLNWDFIAATGERVCLAVQPANTQTIGDGGTLYVEPEAKDIFPPYYGAITIRNLDYVYEKLTVEGSQVKLENISASMMPNTADPFPGGNLTVTNENDDPYTGDFIILSPRNYDVIATGSSESVTVGGNLKDAVSIFDAGPIKRKADINAEDFTANLSRKETNPGFIQVDNDAKTVNIGGGLTSASFGSAWFDANKNIGGSINYCQAGKCLFGTGIRAFFMLDYSGSGDGLTFALLNGDNNSSNSAGGDIEQSELLGYAGDSRTDAAGTTFLDGVGNGLRPPKMALEIDTKTNYDATFEDEAIKDYCSSSTSLRPNTRNDPLSNDRDVLQYVFWGNNALTIPCRNNKASYDDNRHNAEGDLSLNWSYEVGVPVQSSPAIGPEGTIYIVMNGALYALDPNGTLKWNNSSHSLGFSPAVDPIDGTIYTVGNTDHRVYAFNPDGSEKNGNWPFNTGADIDAAPIVGPDRTVYAARDYVDGTNRGKVFAIKPDGTSKGANWPFAVPTAGPNDIDSGPIVAADGTVYAASEDGYLWAIDSDGNEKWHSTVGYVQGLYAAGIGPDGSIYVGSDDGKVYAFNPDGTSKAGWPFTTGSTVRSTPTVAADGTIYVGSRDGRLYALNPSGTKKWHYSTGGEVDSKPAVDSEGTIYVGSANHNVYALNPDGTIKWTFATGASVRSSPAVGDDGTVYIGSDDGKFYSIARFAAPRNYKDRMITSTRGSSGFEVGGEVVGVLADEDNWLKDGPWAVRMEVIRSDVPNADGGYDYVLHTWVRQCNDSNCSNVLGTFFQDTRIEYAAKSPQLEQTINLDPTQFNRFLFGFTGAVAAGESQNAVISEFQLSFIRPADPIITTDPDWP
jgi:outer membrane protein assembly factor BamB